MSEQLKRRIMIDIKKIYKRWFSPNIEYEDLDFLKNELAFRNYSRMRVLAPILAAIMAVFLVVDIFVVNHYKNERIVDFLIAIMSLRLLVIGASIFFVLLTGKVAEAQNLNSSHKRVWLAYLFVAFYSLALLSALLVPLKPGIGPFMMTILAFTSLFRVPGKTSLLLYLPAMFMVILTIVLIQNNHMLMTSDIMTAVFMSICGLVTMRILYCSWVREYFNLRLLERQNRELQQKNSVLSENRQTPAAALDYYFDPITEMPNRLGFMEVLKKEWKRAQREKSEISIVVADIELFSALIARNGKAVGDACLEKVAGAVKNGILRPGDMAARFGYDEFAIVLPQTDSHGAEKVAERIKKSVDELKIPHPTSEDGLLKIEVACVSIRPEAEDKPEDALQRVFQSVCGQGKIIAAN